MSDYRTCSNCGYPKPLCEFPKRGLKFKFGYVCKECKRAKLTNKLSEEAKTKKEYLDMYGTMSRHLADSEMELRCSNCQIIKLAK